MHFYEKKNETFTHPLDDTGTRRAAHNESLRLKCTGRTPLRLPQSCRKRASGFAGGAFLMSPEDMETHHARFMGLV